jgi:hypothetical protein
VLCDHGHLLQVFADVLVRETHPGHLNSRCLDPASPPPPVHVTCRGRVPQNVTTATNLTLLTFRASLLNKTMVMLIRLP